MRTALLQLQHTVTVLNARRLEATARHDDDVLGEQIYVTCSLHAAGLIKYFFSVAAS